MLYIKNNKNNPGSQYCRIGGPGFTTPASTPTNDGSSILHARREHFGYLTSKIADFSLENQFVDTIIANKIAPAAHHTVQRIYCRLCHG